METYIDERGAAVNSGQLKKVAMPFYHRLIEEGYSAAYPWDGASGGADDYALANNGQAKQLFRFDLTLDSDGDTLPDSWERANGLNANDPSDAALDSDNDGLSNLAEFAAGTRANNADTNGNNVTDGAELSAGTNPRKLPDSDDDGVPDDFDAWPNQKLLHHARIAVPRDAVIELRHAPWITHWRVK